MGIQVKNINSFIGQALSGGTTGSVLFVGANKEIQQDNANLFWDDTNNRLGIGTATPTTKLDIKATGTAQNYIEFHNSTGGINARVRNNADGSAGFTTFDSTGATVQASFGGGGFQFGASIDASSALQIDSTTKGGALPRMTTTQKNAISAPLEGLEVYDLTLHKKSVFTGTVWETVTSV